jgi:4'-phosphopantetheinyl transferase
MPQLPNEQIHLWTVCTSSTLDSRLIDRCRKLLSTREIHRAGQFIFDKDRVLYLLSHALVRVMLSAFCYVRPHEWQFSEDSYGKPHVCDGFPKLRFNLTHTEGLIACVVSSNHEVGVDAEFMDATVDLDIARNYFSQSEIEHVEKAPKEAIHEVFFDIWTLKESYIKAIGLGLSVPLNSFSISLRTGHEPALSFTSGSSDDTSMCRFFRARPSPRHCLAVCVRYPSRLPCHLLTRQLSPLAIFAKPI